MIRFARLSSVFSLVVLTASSVASAQPFEGVVNLRMSGRSGSPPMDAEYLSRNGNARVNIPSSVGTMSILGIATESKTYMLMESQRVYREMPSGDAATASSAAGEMKVTKTGRHETIAGLSCEHVILESSGTSNLHKIDMCVTRGLGPFVMPTTAGGVSDWQRQVSKDGGFPLKVTLGDGTVALEVTKIEKKRVSDELFRIPADYTKMEMPRRP